MGNIYSAKEFCKNLKREREARHLTVKDVHKGSGVSYGTLLDHERELRISVDASVVERVAKFFGITVDDMINKYVPPVKPDKKPYSSLTTKFTMYSSKLKEATPDESDLSDILDPYAPIHKKRISKSDKKTLLELRDVYGADKLIKILKESE